MNPPKLYTVSLALQSLADPSSAIDRGAFFAMALLSPVFVFTLFDAFPK
jgi:ABC-type maltose transport system permease subunit